MRPIDYYIGILSVMGYVYCHWQDKQGIKLSGEGIPVWNIQI